jgi:ribonuclease D
MQAEDIHPLSKQDINALPLFSYKSKIIQVVSPQALAQAMERLCREKILGFDTETRPSFRKGATHSPALIQLACSDVVYLFLLRRVPLGPELAYILANPGILKVGVAIQDDLRCLTSLYTFEAAGTVDLSKLARQNGLQAYGLRSLAAELLHLRISKSARCSNWENSPLTAQQINYASTDAWISREIYMYMLAHGFNLRQEPVGA